MAQPRSLRLVFLYLFVFGAAFGQEAQSEKKIPPALEQYMGRRIAYTMGVGGADWLIRRVRQQEEDCETLLRQLKLNPGMTVCDMGCGNGFYALQMAEFVGEKGNVLAVDIQSGMLRLLQARAEEQGVKNVKPILSSVVDAKLPKGKVDLILCVDVYHEFSHPEQMLKCMRESLTAKGLIALAEYREEDPDVPIKPLHKMSKKQILREYSANGLKLVRQYDELPWQHLMFFGRDEARTKSKSAVD
jgi:ubiquinone/menaquinone biosynthesis C-methylase UbiE